MSRRREFQAPLLEPSRIPAVQRQGELLLHWTKAVGRREVQYPAAFQDPRRLGETGLPFRYVLEQLWHRHDIETRIRPRERRSGTAMKPDWQAGCLCTLARNANQRFID